MKHSLQQIFGTITGGVAVLTILWYSMDYIQVRPIIKREFVYSRSEVDERNKVLTAQLDQANQAILLIQFQLLMQKREYGGLTFAEQQELCRLAYVLGYVGVPGCPT